MFNPHIHQQQQQQQQQLHQHLRQLQQLFQQQPPPPPPAQPPPAHHVGHHHQTPRTIPVPTQTAPPPRMVNLCQTTQTTLIAPNPMLQSAILMQQMQGNMRGFGMGGQQFRQFFTAGARSSLLGPVPMGMAIKSPIMGFPAARAFHPHTRFFNATASSSSSSSSTSATDAAARQADRKRDSEQMSAGSSDNPPAAAAAAAAANSADEATDEAATDGAVGGENSQTSEEQLEEPVSKRQKTEGSEEPKEQHVTESVTTAQSESNSNTVDTQSEGCVIQEDECFSGGPDDVAIEENKADNACGGLPAPSPSAGPAEDTEQVSEPTEEAAQDKDASLGFPDSQDEEEASEGSNKFYCYLCSITCFNQQNFRSHMNSISHQQRMMEIQHMSNACLVTLLPRVQESLQGASKDGEKKADLKQWCGTCHTHFTSSISDHHRSEEHKLASKTDLSFCAVCQKRFKTSQNFIEHLHSQEHKQKIKEKGCETLTKLTNMGTDGFSCELEAQELEKNEGDQGSSEDGWPSAKEVALNDMTSDEQYDPDTIYGSSFLDPVAGFLCRLCNKFYLFESSALHSHCKSLQHFENLKSYKAMVGEKGEDTPASTKSIRAADGLRSATEASDCSQENLLTIDTSEADGLNSTKSISLTKLKTQEDQLKEKESEAASISLDFSQQPSPDHEESPVPPAAVSRKEADSAPAAAAAAGDSNGEEEEEEEAPAGPGKKNCGGKGRSVGKRRSGRAANRR
ncbi:cdkn1a interacting zinc finger protein 1a [Poecilia formosa]|uniref:Cdkn1a interacting zinc finger protein 1a n=1 Tax=Poecilia formosa TaxID=48698 RepID=A0A087YPM1_POEFO|nr:PREDICTED: cip1-interacting zinc finger protein [Poecilia formosa]XP_016535810.1 PREDICTED: cip1-interacting zinc finger protein [Poecilia formosa]